MKLGIVGTGQIVEEVLPQLGGWGWTAQVLCGTPRSEEKVRKLTSAYDIPPTIYTIQGTDGCICLETPANRFDGALLRLRDGTEKHFQADHTSRLEPEFRFFAREIASGDRTNCYAQLDHSVLVSRILTEARLGAGIHFPSDDIK